MQGEGKPASEPLNVFLRRVRKERKLTLRDVEQITGGKVSNALLSQIETGKVKSPSAITLHRLAAAYAADFGEMLERAGEPSVALPPCCPTCGRELP